MSFIRHQHPSYSSSFPQWTEPPLFFGAQSASSMIRPCPTRILLEQATPIHHRPRYRNILVLVSKDNVGRFLSQKGALLTFFLYCLWIASSASFIVTPFMFRAVTSSPSGKCKSIFLTGGFVRNFLRTSFSSSVAGEVFSFLQARGQS